MRFLEGHPPPYELTYNESSSCRTIGGDVADGRRPGDGRLGAHHPGGGGQHDGGGGPADGGDGGAPWRHCRSAARPSISTVKQTIDFVKSRDRWWTPGRADARRLGVGCRMRSSNKRAHGVAVVGFEGRLIGLVTEAGCVGVDPFARVRDVAMSDLSPHRWVPTRARYSTYSTRPDRGGGDDRARRALAGVLTRTGRSAPVSTPRRWTTGAACASPQRSASTATSAPRRAPWPRRAWTCWLIDTAHGHQLLHAGPDPARCPRWNSDCR